MKHGLGLSQAFRTMTIVPVPGKDAEKASSQLFFYPFVGSTVGFIGSLILWICYRFTNINAVSILVFGVL